MSSSNRITGPLNGLIVQGGEPVGSLQLPDKEKAAFIEQFNLRYAALGLHLEERAECDSNEYPIQSRSDDR